MSDAACSPDWRERLNAAAQSGKARVSVRTLQLRTLLSAELRAGSQVTFLRSDLTRQEALAAALRETTGILQDERDDLKAANDWQADRIATLTRDLRDATAEAKACAEELGQVTKPKPVASIIRVLLFAALCFAAGMAIQRFWMPPWC